MVSACAASARTFSPGALPALSRKLSIPRLRSRKGRTPRFAGLRTASRSHLTASWRRESALGASRRSRLGRFSRLLAGAQDEAVPTLFGSLRGKLWKGGAHLALSRGTATDQRMYITCWVVREGAVVLGHNCAPVDTIQASVSLSWSVEPNWYGHRHLVNAVCEGLWRVSGQEVGEACIAHRRGLRKQGVLATFTCLGEGHWTTAPLTAKILVDESRRARTLCFVFRSTSVHPETCRTGEANKHFHSQFLLVGILPG